MLGLVFYGPSTVNAWAHMHEDDRALHRTSTLTAWETPKDVHGLQKTHLMAPQLLSLSHPSNQLTRQSSL
jgi:hypothetical protein